MSVLTAEQARRYQTQGYLLASGLIPAEVAQRADEAMWRGIKAQPNDRATWGGPIELSEEDAQALVACYTPAFLAAAAQLVGEDISTFPPPKRPFPINTYPQDAEWKPPNPHIDHAIKAHGHKVFPHEFRIATMTFLHDIEPHGGGTVVWAGSHLKIERLAKSDPVYYEMMWTLNQELDKADIGEPTELTPKQGDVLFYHYLCAHAGSMNVRERPRFAMNCKW